jgi:hypothetical protein
MSLLRCLPPSIVFTLKPFREQRGRDVRMRFCIYLTSSPFSRRTPKFATYCAAAAVTLSPQLLERNRELHAHHRGELDQYTVASRLDDPPEMLRNKLIGSGTMYAQHGAVPASSASITRL